MPEQDNNVIKMQFAAIYSQQQKKELLKASPANSAVALMCVCHCVRACVCECESVCECVALSASVNLCCSDVRPLTMQLCSQSVMFAELSLLV